jgi:hypothetical protein
VYNSPVITNPYLSKDTVFTSSENPIIDFSTSVKVDVNGGDPIKYVICKLNSPNGQLLDSALMSDNGVLPDSVANDGRYSCSFREIGMLCLLVGEYSVQYYAQNNAGLFSNLINKPLFVVNTINLPPILSNLVIPDSVVRPLSGSFDLTLSITVWDPDGPCDINSVVFDAYRPSGFYLGRNPMTASSNNTFTFTAAVTPASADSLYGFYKYIFRAYDNSNTPSNVITDSIKFVRP